MGSDNMRSTYFRKVVNIILAIPEKKLAFLQAQFQVRKRTAGKVTVLISKPIFHWFSCKCYLHDESSRPPIRVTFARGCLTKSKPMDFTNYDFKLGGPSLITSVRNGPEWSVDQCYHLVINLGNDQKSSSLRRILIKRNSNWDLKNSVE